ncbi:hypothetical protein BCY84_20169 [Trypanosoma cruzi cruzi]|nr:hypothetical protein BCY84_20169 [Trypanosoma cruzi cruzi]
MVALSKHIIRARQLRRKLAAAVEPATGTHAHRHHPHSWGGGCTGPPPHRGFAQIRMAATAPAARHPEHMPLVQLGCRTAGTQRILHGNASSSRWTPPHHGPTAGGLPGVRQALRLPRECRDARVQRPWHYALPGAVEVNSSWCAGAAGNSTGTTARHLSEDEGEGRHTDRTPPRNAEPRPRPFADRRCTTNEPGSELFSGTSTCSTAPEHEGGVPVNMTIRLHPPRSGARPVDSLPKRKREQHPIHAHTHAPEQSRSRHQGPQHSMDFLTATGGRAMPGQASHTRHNLSGGESITTPKIESQCTRAAKLETQREEGQARPATLSPRETPSSAQEANAGGGRRTVRPK